MFQIKCKNIYNQTAYYKLWVGHPKLGDNQKLGTLITTVVKNFLAHKYDATVTDKKCLEILMNRKRDFTSVSNQYKNSKCSILQVPNLVYTMLYTAQR